MNFDNLEVAIHLNRSESPSLSMAFYLIQNLVKDMETASGMKFKNVDLGNADEFPILLAGQCRLIKSVYESNVSFITRNRERLAQLNEILSDIQQELDDGVNVHDDIVEKEKEYERMQQQKEKLLQDKKMYEQISAECAVLTADIQKMEHYDISIKEKEAEQLKKKYQSFDGKKRELSESIHTLEQANHQLEEEVRQLAEENTRQQQRKNELEKQKNDFTTQLYYIETLIPSLTKENGEKQQQLSQLSERQKTLEQEKDSLALQIANKQEKYNQFYREHIEPLQTQNNELSVKVSHQENEKQHLIDSKKSLTERYQKLLSDISALPEEIKELEKNISEQQTQKVVFDRQKNDFESKYKELLKQVAVVQNETITLSTESIPRVQKLFTIAKSDNAEKRQQLNDINQQIDTIKKDTAATEQNMADSNVLLAQKRREFEDLRTRYHLKSEEIAKLENQLTELKGKTNKEQFATLQNQLRADIEELRKLEQQEKEITGRCVELQKSIQKETETLEKLRRNRAEYEKKLAELKNAQNTMNRYRTKEFQEEFTHIREKADFVQGQKDKLFHASEKLLQIVSKEKFQISQNGSMMSDDLQIIDEYLSDVQRCILEDGKNFFVGGE